MCQIRQWKQIESSILSSNHIRIIGTRSDNLIIEIPIIVIKGENDYSVVAKIALAMKKLETYRNCKCFPNAPCDKHKQ